MSAEDVKPWIDMLVALLAAGGGGGIILAVLGYMRAKVEKEPPKPEPQVGGGALAQIGGMVMGQQTAHDIIEALTAISSAHDRCTLSREAEMLSRKTQWADYQRFHKEAAKDREEHERRLSRETHELYTQLVDVLRILNRRIEDMPGCNN